MAPHLDDRVIERYVFRCIELAQMAATEMRTFESLFDARWETRDISDLNRSLRSFLSLAAGVSKLLWGASNRTRDWTDQKEQAFQVRQERSRILREIANIDDDCILKDRDVRNSFEHLDERMDDHVAAYDLDGKSTDVVLAWSGIVDQRLVDQGMNLISMGTIDPATFQVVWGDKKISLRSVEQALADVHRAMSRWLQARGVREIRSWG